MTTITKPGRGVGYRANRYVVMLGYSVPTAPAGLEVVHRLEVHSSLVALGQPVQRTGRPFVLGGIARATSPIALNPQQS